MSNDRNVFFGLTNWYGVVELARSKMNGYSVDGRPLPSGKGGVVYLSNCSWGIREAEGVVVDKIHHEWNGEWMGYSQEGAKRFLWGSAHSPGATIEAVRLDRVAWELRFVGVLDPDVRESNYVLDFLSSIYPGSLRIESKDSARLERLLQSIEQHTPCFKERKLLGL